MRQMLKLILHHPAKLAASLVIISIVYSYARVLVLQYLLGALQDSIHRYPKNFPHGFFLPFFYVSTTTMFFAAIAHDFLVLHSTGLWKYVLPLPLTIRRGWYRIIGVPLYAFVLAIIEIMQLFRNPAMESDLSRLAAYFQSLRQQQTLLDDATIRALVADIKWQAWSLQTPTNPTTLSYIRLPFDIILAIVVCGVYGIAIFCNEPRHDGEELREAARNNDIARVKIILDRGVNPNSRSGDGSTALHICAQQAMPNIAQVLLNYGADPNKADRLGFTPLHWAVQIRREEISSTNRLEMIKLLVNNGADPRQADANGVTSLSIASKKENESSLAILQEALGDIVRQ